jgi:nitroreductase
MENILLAATNEGVSSIYLTKFLERITPETELFHKLNIPTGFIPLSAAALGYSEENQEKNSVNSMRERIPTEWL